MNYVVTADGGDTICAVSTPPGTGGIAVIRVSGPKAITIAGKVWRGKPLHDAASHTAHLGTIVDPDDDSVLDQSVATIFRTPASFTGEDVVELSIHGSRWLQREIVSLLIRQGCRLAEPGEFTRRAFTAGRLDLAEAEAVADVIASTSRAAHRVAVSQMRGGLSDELSRLHDQLLELAALLELELDFSEEDVEFASREHLLDIARRTLGLTERLTSTFASGKALREGVPVAIVGRTNAGKSTLLNTLACHERAIVSDIHGTTRDTIEETIDIDGIPFRLIDTAGLRKTDDPIENLGIERSHKAIADARIVLWVIDPAELTASKENDEDNATAVTDSMKAMIDEIIPRISPETSLIVVLNKSDLYNNVSQTYCDILGTLLQPHPSCPTHSPARTSSHKTTLPSPNSTILSLSARDNLGIDQLRRAMTKASGLEDALNSDQTILTNLRHYQALTAASSALAAVITGLTTSLPGDLIAQDLREAIYHLGTITGAITTPDILTTIFSRFCIGK